MLYNICSFHILSSQINYFKTWYELHSKRSLTYCLVQIILYTIVPILQVFE